tara:strand:- start:119 stop:289 length:171 start_codon:yes stop_codon:yes gene_type:complete
MSFLNGSNDSFWLFGNTAGRTIGEELANQGIARESGVKRFCSSYFSLLDPVNFAVI